MRRPRRPVLELGRAGDAQDQTLPAVRRRVLLVAPAAVEAQEADGVAAAVGRREVPRGAVEDVLVRRQHWVPQRAAVALIHERADEQVQVGDGVVVRPICPQVPWWVSFERRLV